MKVLRSLRRGLLALVALTCLPLAGMAQPALTEGKDYDVIANGAPWQPLAGKIEVVEVFGYTCGHCDRFEGFLKPWKAKLPADVRFTPVPAAFGGFWDAWARAYFAAEQLNVTHQSHSAVFNAIHRTRDLPAQGVTPTQLAGFYQRFGADPAAFRDALGSDRTNKKMEAARQFAQRSRITGTPSLVVNGKYLVKGETFEDMLRITDALVSRERAARARR